jgi:hypothetical protein
MASGPALMQMVGAPTVLLTLALTHMLQAGSYFGSLRFGFDGERNPAGAATFGLAAGFIAMLVIAAGYVLAFFMGQALLAPDTLVLALFLLALPLVVVYALFFAAAAVMAAATIIALLMFLFVYGLVMGYPELPLAAFGGSGAIVVVMLLLSYLLFWLAARFSCVMPLMAERGDLNVFSAIAASWRLTWEEQWRITRYLALVGFGIALVGIGISFAVGASTGELMRGGSSIVESGTGGVVLGLLFGIPLAFLSVMLPAGIYRHLVGETAAAEIFE